MKVNDKETFQGDHLGENIGTWNALTMYDQTPMRLTLQTMGKHLRFDTK